MSARYDAVLVGTGFASSFFLARYLARSEANVRVLVLERGRRWTHDEQIVRRSAAEADAADTFLNRTPAKPWRFSVGFGGSSNCWWACTPRMLPEDFELHSRYGVGRDWPVSYDALERFYDEAEAMMSVAGDGGPGPRSRPYPQPAHVLSTPDKAMKSAWPGLFFPQPTARPTQDTTGRPACCGSGVCGLCPIDSKFTVLNEMSALYQDPRVTLRLGATALAVATRGGVATGVHYRHGGQDALAEGDLVVLGANAIFNPAILLRSGVGGAGVGQRLCEQVSVSAWVNLDGMNAFDGSTAITGHGYMLYGGEHRRERSAALMETWNVPELRPERGRWRQRIRVKLIFEDLPVQGSRVTVDDTGQPAVTFGGRSDYALKSIGMAGTLLNRALAPLPVEQILVNRNVEETESHIIGTTVMGTSPADSVVDPNLLHHRVRNLMVLGSSVFPTAAPANPTLTLCALALRAAEHVTA